MRFNDCKSEIVIVKKDQNQVMMKLSQVGKEMIDRWKYTEYGLGYLNPSRIRKESIKEP